MSREFLANNPYQLALDAVASDHRLAALRDHIKGNQMYLNPLQTYLELFWQEAQREKYTLPMRVTQEMEDNLKLGASFSQEFVVDELKMFHLSYSPEAYRTFMNYFTSLLFAGQLHPEFSSPFFVESGFNSYLFYGLIGERELRHLTHTKFVLLTNLIRDFNDMGTAFTPNKKLFSEASDALELPKAVAERPRVLLHGRFNGFPSLNYNEAIFSTVTRFAELPCFIIGIDGDSTSVLAENQAPFMNQVFRAGFYSFSPLVESVFLADEKAYKDPDSYWGRVYSEMELDYLVLEEKDPNFEKKQERLKKSTGGKGQIIIHQSEKDNIPRLSGRDIKRGDPGVVAALEAKWRQLTLNLTLKYFKDDKEKVLVHFLDRGTRKGSIQTPLFLV